MKLSILIVVLFFSYAYSAPNTNTNCPNGITPRDAQKCSEKIDSYTEQLENVNEEDAMKPKTVRLMKSYCDTFKNCYTPVKLCDLYDPAVGNLMQSVCDFYEFLARNEIRKCSTKLENAKPNAIRCLNEIADTLMDVEASSDQRCSVFRSDIQCAVTEVQTICDGATASEFQKFFYYQAQVWSC